MISICSLIYRSAAFADATVESLLEYTPHLHDGRARFFFVANDATPELKEHLRQRGYPFVVQENKVRTAAELQDMGYAPPEYIHRVYRGYNRAIIEGEEQSVLINSDMQFSPGWLEGLEEAWNPKRIVTSTLVERWQNKMGDRRTGPNYFIECDFGSHPKNFDKRGFYAFSQNRKQAGVIPGRHYASIMLSKKESIAAGLYPEGNLFAPWGIYSGDRAFFSRMKSNGVEHLESTNSIVYHFNEGEIEDTNE